MLPTRPWGHTVKHSTLSSDNPEEGTTSIDSQCRFTWQNNQYSLSGCPGLSCIVTDSFQSPFTAKWGLWFLLTHVCRSVKSWWYFANFLVSGVVWSAVQLSNTNDLECCKTLAGKAWKNGSVGESTCHTSMKTWVWIARTHVKGRGMVGGQVVSCTCNPSVGAGRDRKMIAACWSWALSSRFTRDTVSKEWSTQVEQDTWHPALTSLCGQKGTL